MSLTVGASQVAAHGGRLDSNGGHYNRKTGKYHTHRGGSNFGSIALIVIGGIFRCSIFTSLIISGHSF